MNRLKLAKIIRNSFLNKTKVYFLLRFLVKKDKAIKTLRKFKGDDLAQKEERHYLEMMRQAMVRYHWEFDEFFLYQYLARDHQQRLEIVPEYEKNLFCDRLNDDRSQHVFDDKWETYNKFSKYYRRDVCLLNGGGVDVFFEKHDKAILKPRVSSLGRGIRIVNKDDMSNFNVTDDYILEEVICQNSQLASLHPQSVNTMRVHTVNRGGEIYVFKPYLRIGRGGSVVDNAGAGGIFSEVSEKGVIIKAVDELGHSYIYHPDTNVKLIGFQIPQWDEALSLATELAKVVPDNRYTGWDLALTNSGWVMVEGNTRAQFVFQIPSQKGFRKEFEVFAMK